MTALDYARIANVYDAYVRFDDDIPFFVEAARAADGRVLELMAGTGRVSLPLAVEGVDLTAVDAVVDMLAVLAAKARGRGLAPALCCADARSLPFDGGFALVLLPFQGFSELLTADDQRRALASIHRALEPGGHVVLTLHNPRVRLASITGDWVEAVRSEQPETGGEIVVRFKTAFDRDAEIVRGLQRIEEYGPTGDLARAIELPLTFSLTGRSDFRHLVREAGFEVVSLAGDFEGRSFHDATSPLMVWTLAREKRLLGGWRSAPEPEPPPTTRSPKGAPAADEEGSGSYSYELAPEDGGAEPRPKDVFLSVSTPPMVAPNSGFTVHFSAYVDAYRSRVAAIVRRESPRAEPLLDLETCQWKEETEITVYLVARGLEIESRSQTFTWNGRYSLLRFDAAVPAGHAPGPVVLELDVAIAGSVVARLRQEIQVVAGAERSEGVSREIRFPRTAFASYASGDRKDVMGRVRSLQIATRMDVFVDCLSIRPGERWKPSILDEIRRRDVFWLFWSRRAQDSEWVDWEWRTALAEKTIDGIQPHPLEPADVAPAPPELADLQFGSMYEQMLLSLDRGAGLR